jgi:hypothetical protein
VQHVLGGDRLAADPRLGERDVLGHPRVEVVAHHRHVEVLVERVDGVRVGRVRRRREAVRLARDADDVRGMPASRALRVVGVDGPAGDRVHRVLEEPGLVERVRVDLDLHVQLVARVQRCPDDGRHRAPVLVDLEPDGARAPLLEQRRDVVGGPLAEEPEVDRERLGGLEHPAEVHGARRADPDGDGPEASAQHRRDPARDRLLAQAGRVEVHVHVDRSRGGDHPLGGAHVGARPHDEVGVDALHGARVAGLADPGDPAVLDPDVRLHDAGNGVDHEDVRDHEVQGAVGHGDRTVRAEAVTQRLAAAEHALVAGDEEVVLDLGPEIGVAQADAVPRGRPEQLGVLAP